jgi:hypothetical protein
MAAVVSDYTALTAATGFKEPFPIGDGTPWSGLKKDFWRKVRLDFSKTGLTDGLAAKIMTIPAHTLVLEVMTCILTVEAAGAGITIGDTTTDHDNVWVTTQAGDTLDILFKTPAATNMAAGGKYYHAGGALYMYGTSAFDTLQIDVYVKCMIVDPL